MDLLREHRKYVRTVRRLAAVGRFANAVLWLPLSGIVVTLAIFYAPQLNANAGALTAVLTAVLVAITAYYAWWTRRLVGVEERRRIEDARPLLLVDATHTGYANPRDPELVQCVIQARLSCQNAAAMNIQLFGQLPYCPKAPEDQDVQYIRVRPDVDALGAIKSGDTVDIQLSVTIRAHQVPRSTPENAYVVLTVACEDRLQNYHEKSVYFSLQHSPLGNPSLNRYYEWTRLIPSEKRPWILTRSFGTVTPRLDDATEVVQRGRES